MSTYQPSYHCIANLGDVDPVEYGGKFLCIDRRGIYDPCLIVVEIENRDGKDKWVRHDIGLERCHRIFSDESEIFAVGDSVYHPHLPAWFGDGKSLDSVASYFGMKREELIDKLCSTNPIERASGYIAVAGNYGEDNFDQYPMTYESKRQVSIFCNRMLKQVANSSKWWDGLHK